MAGRSLHYSDLVPHEKLGTGADGIVTRVTFKRPYQGLREAAAKQVEQLREEANILQSLNHPNVIKLYGCVPGQFNTTILLLEYAPLGTVRDYVTQLSSPIPVGLLKKWSRESALALQYLHQKRLIHRDVKGSNCLLFVNFQLKLSDFGLARKMESSMVSSTAKGTWRYMAPEVHKDHHFSFKSDMYAYGMLVLEMGSGQKPFAGEESAHVVYHVGANNLQPAIPRHFPEQLSSLLMRCWSLPEERPSPAETLDAISGLPDESDTTHYLREAASSSPYHRWHLVREFGKAGGEEGEFQGNVNIAVCHNGDIVVGDVPDSKKSKHLPGRVYMFTNEGKFKDTLKPPEAKPDKHTTSSRSTDVAVTLHGHIAVTNSESKDVKLFNEHGTYLHSFFVLSNDGTRNRNIQPWCMTVASNGDILVGYMGRKRIITIHEPNNGRLQKVVQLNIEPHYLTTNSQQLILVSNCKARKVQAINYAGHTLFSLDSFTVDGEPGLPLGLVCDGHDHVYIAVMKVTERGKCLVNTGHIHQYSSWGRFMRCIIADVYAPHGIAWHNDSLYVSNYSKSVLIYSETWTHCNQNGLKGHIVIHSLVSQLSQNTVDVYNPGCTELVRTTHITFTLRLKFLKAV